MQVEKTGVSCERERKREKATRFLSDKTIRPRVARRETCTTMEYDCDRIGLLDESRTRFKNKTRIDVSGNVSEAYTRAYRIGDDENDDEDDDDDDDDDVGPFPKVFEVSAMAEPTDVPSGSSLFRDCTASNGRAGTIESAERSLARGKVQTDKVQTQIDGQAEEEKRKRRKKTGRLHRCEKERERDRQRGENGEETGRYRYATTSRDAIPRRHGRYPIMLNGLLVRKKNENISHTGEGEGGETRYSRQIVIANLQRRIARGATSPKVSPAGRRETNGRTQRCLRFSHTRYMPV